MGGSRAVPGAEHKTKPVSGRGSVFSFSPFLAVYNMAVSFDPTNL